MAKWADSITVSLLGKLGNGRMCVVPLFREHVFHFLFGGGGWGVGLEVNQR